MLSPLRSKALKQVTLIKALRQQMRDFDEFELERLRHAFVKLSGGDSRVAKLTSERIRWVWSHNAATGALQQSNLLIRVGGWL